MGTETENRLKKQTYLVVGSMCMVYTSAILFAFGFLSTPLREGSLIFPFSSWYPFNWKKLPLYEIIYVLQWFTNVYVIITAICGHDNLFLASASNCIAQYLLLKEVLKKIGTEDSEGLLKRLEQPGDKYEKGQKDNDMKLLVKCVKHHNTIIKYYLCEVDSFLCVITFFFAE